MPREYKVTKVSQEQPREYTGQYGTVYYIKAMVEGHNKPISVGKKDPHGLKVGDVLYGDIKTSDYPEDSFKAAQKPQFGGGGVSPDITSKLDSIAGDVKLLLSFVRQMQKGNEPKPDPVIDVNPDEDISLDDFGGEEPISMEDIPF